MCREAVEDDARREMLSLVSMEDLDGTRSDGISRRLADLPDNEQKANSGLEIDKLKGMGFGVHLLVLANSGDLSPCEQVSYFS